MVVVYLASDLMKHTIPRVLSTANPKTKNVKQRYQVVVISTLIITDFNDTQVLVV